MRRSVRSGVLWGVFLVVLYLGAVPAAAQDPSIVTPTSALWFEHNGVDTTGFELQVDAGAFVPVTSTRVEGTPESWWTPMPAMTPGLHTLVLRACGPGGCSVGSTPLDARVVVVPEPPRGVRIAPPPGSAP